MRSLSSLTLPISWFKLVESESDHQDPIRTSNSRGLFVVCYVSIVPYMFSAFLISLFFNYGGSRIGPFANNLEVRLRYFFPSFLLP